MPASAFSGALVLAQQAQDCRHRKAAAMQEAHLAGEVALVDRRSAVAALPQGLQRGLVVDDMTNEHLRKSLRNLPRAKFIAPEGLNVYDILRHDTLVLTVPVVKRIEERLLP